LRASILGVEKRKLDELWLFETSDYFDASEKAALRLAVAAGQSPNVVTDELFAEVVAHFGEDGAVEISAVLAMTAFTNRWNETVGTDLEIAVRQSDTQGAGGPVASTSANET
jgi:alkylhydroperoxidase family enzyme